MRLGKRYKPELPPGPPTLDLAIKHLLATTDDIPLARSYSQANTYLEGRLENIAFIPGDCVPSFKNLRGRET